MHKSFRPIVFTIALSMTCAVPSAAAPAFFWSDPGLWLSRAVVWLQQGVDTPSKVVGTPTATKAGAGSDPLGGDEPADEDTTSVAVGIDPNGASSPEDE